MYNSYSEMFKKLALPRSRYDYSNYSDGRIDFIFLDIYIYFTEGR